MYWYETESVSDPIICNNSSSNCSKSSSTSHGNPLILQSTHPILDSLNIYTSNLNDKSFDAIFLKHVSSEVNCVLIDNNININLEKWGGRRKKELIRIISFGHLKYNKFK